MVEKKPKELVYSRKKIWQDVTLCLHTSCKDRDGSRVNTLKRGAHIFTVDLLAAVLVNLCASERLQD